MHNPLAGGLRLTFAIARSAFQVEDNVLADAANFVDARALQNGRDFLCRRFQRLGFFAQPDGLDHVAGDALVQSARYGFDLGKLRHKGIVYGTLRGKEAFRCQLSVFSFQLKQ